ncbi:MAG TPA: hypothetical protein DD671_01465 [Balneolaceae bacterium]|nr:hypothetical protein [Balneola sp.]HBQ58318.1 hypothetical protein [Balneolaceae bacterium]
MDRKGSGKLPDLRCGRYLNKKAQGDARTSETQRLTPRKSARKKCGIWFEINLTQSYAEGTADFRRVLLMGIKKVQADA